MTREPTAHPIPPAFVPAFERLITRHETTLLPYDAVVELALFSPEIGYYTKPKKRVGQEAPADFYTAASLGPLFGRLCLEAAAGLLQEAGLAPEAHTLVELGAEPEYSAFQEDTTPFAGHQIVRLGEDIVLPQNAVVFANELLDAQPFKRFQHANGAWTEIGVAVDIHARTLQERPLHQPTPAGRALIEQLPAASLEGYCIDLSLNAESLLASICRLPWTGLLLFFDYGHFWEEITEVTPQGSARAYYRHQQHNELLAHFGDQDLTCHVCWERLVQVLEAHSFAGAAVSRQERFFMHHAQNEIGRIISGAAERFDAEKQMLQQLLHPAHMGHKFQALHAVRR